MLERLLNPSFRLAGRGLLLVDVPSDERDRLASALRNEGADVVACSSAWEALLALQLDAFDAVVARLELAPRGGFWLLERARAEAEAFPDSAAVRFVALSQGGSSETAARAARAGFVAFHDAREAPEALVTRLAEVLPADPLVALAQGVANAKLRRHPAA